MNKQRKTSNILNVFQYDEATGIIGLNGVPVSGYGLYLHTNINDGSVGIDSSASINAMYLLKNGTKQFEISYDTTNANPIFRLLPYQTGSFFEIGNPSNAGTDYVFIAEPTYGNVMIGPGLGNGTGNLTGATASIHKIQLHGKVFGDDTIQAAGFKVTGGSGFIKADGTTDNTTYLSGNQTITVSGDASGSGTTSINLTLANTAVTPGTYGSTTLVPVVTVDSKGRITNVTTAAISGALTFTGDVTGSGTTGTSTALTLANSGVTAGTYTKVTVDLKGRVTVGASATTSDIAEGTNLYYTSARFDTAFAGKSTTNLAEGTNLYYTDARVLAYLGANNYATQSYVGTQIANLVASAPAALDTLNELAAALGNDASFATTTATSLGNRLRVDIGTQGLTSTQQGYGRTNLGLGTAATSAVGDFATAAQGTKADSAYGWGNHASAGYLTSATAATTYASLSGSYANPAWITSLAYSKITGVPAFLTSYTETDTLSSVTGRGASTSTAVTFSGGATISNLLLNGAAAYTEGSLALGAHGTTEGGQLVLNKATSYTYAGHIDMWQDVMRFLYGTNTATSGVAMSLNLSTRQLILPQYTTSTTFTGTAAGVLAFDSSGNIITIAVPGGAVSSVSGGTGVSVNSTTGAVVVSIGQSVATSATPSFDQVFTTNNGNGTNVKIGDDVWIGDVNAANTLGIKGQQDATAGYITFGSELSNKLGRTGTGALTWGGNTVYHAGNLTNLNQLTNGPGYITGITSSNVTTALGYTPANSSHTQAWSTITSTPTTLSGYGISDGLYTTTSDFTTTGAGWYRVATTSGDGRGYYFVEVFCTGGNHNPAYLRIEAMGDWGSDKLIAAYTDLGFPANSVRITRGATNTFLEVYFTTTILGASMRVTRLGFNSGTTPYSGSLPGGGDTVKETLSITSKINTASLSINGNAVLHAGNYSSYALPLSGGTLTGPVALNDSSYFRGSSTYGFRFNNNADTLNLMSVRAAGDMYVRGQVYVGGDGFSTGTQLVYNSGTWGITITGDAGSVGGITTSRIIYGDNATGTAYISNATLDGALKSGFYTVGSGGIPNATSVNFVLHTAYYGVGNLAGFDLACNDSTTSQFYLRPATGGGKGAWQTIVTNSGTWGINVTGTAGSISGYNNPTTSATASTIAYRDSGGDLYARYMFAVHFNQSGGNSENPTIGQIWTQNTTDNYVRKSTPAHFISQLGLITSSNIGSQTVLGLNAQFLSTGSVNVSYGYSTVLRNENGAGANLSYSPTLHISASDTMWQIQGTYGTSGNGTMYFRQGYAGSWGNWLTMLSSANYSSFRGTQLISPNGGNVVAADSAMPDTGHSFLHSLALGPGGNDGHILGMTWSGTTSVYGAQIWLDTDPTNRMAIRSRNNAGTWNGWWEVITEGNIGSQSVAYASNSGTVSGLSVHTSRNNEANKIVRTDANGYIQAGWINSDSGNMDFANRIARVQCSDDNYIRYQPLTDFKVSLGLSGKNNYSRRIDYTSDANYHVGSFGHGGTDWGNPDRVFHYGSGFFDIWSGAGTYPSGTTHIHGFNVLHYTTGYGGNAYGWQMASQYNQTGLIYARWCSGGTFSAWQNIITSTNIGSQKVDGALKLWATSHPNDYYIVNNWTGSYWQLTTNHGSGVQVAYANSAGSAGSASSASYAGYLPTLYAGGQQTNPQVYFNNGIGLRAAMTGSWSVWSDTLWVNGYSGSDVKWMCALHFLRNSEPRMAISAQQHDSSSYGSYYEVLSTYNAGYAYNMNQYVRTSDGPTFADVYVTGWFRNHTNNNGIYWSSTGWHLMPYDGADFRMHSGSSGAVALRMETSGTTRGYTYANSSNQIGFLNNSRSWTFRVHSDGRTDLGGDTTASIYVPRHLEASTTWGSCGCLSLFLGWSSSKVVIGNGNSGGHDYANGLGSNSVVSTNPFYCYQDITAYSDSRVKENVEVVDNAVEKIKAIRGVTFTRNDVEDKNKRHAGVIAQEVLAVLPEVVSEDLNGHYSVAYGNLNALLIEAIKEQQKQIEELTNKIDLLIQNK